MKNHARSAVQRLAAATGLDVSRRSSVPPDVDPETAATIEFVRPYTVTSSARVYALCQAVRYVVDNEIPGAIVECGVWRGGSMMAAARTLAELGDRGRDLYLFDTFDGIVSPGPRDLHRSGSPATDLLRRAVMSKDDSGWRAVPLEDVRSALDLVGYPTDRIHYVKGRVEQTIPDQAPDGIAILRLDTDWYESTRHELAFLYPRVALGGVVIVDDYGHWQGARRAVDEYFATRSPRPLLHRVDDTARVAVVPG